MKNSLSCLVTFKIWKRTSTTPKTSLSQDLIALPYTPMHFFAKRVGNRRFRKRCAHERLFKRSATSPIPAQLIVFFKTIIAPFC